MHDQQPGGEPLDRWGVRARRFPLVWLCLVLIGLITSGCRAAGDNFRVQLVDAESIQDTRNDVVVRAQAGESWGQTFIDTSGLGLSGVQLWLQPGSEALNTPDGSGVLVAELYGLESPPTSGGSDQLDTLFNLESPPLERISVPFSTLGDYFPITLHFPPQTESQSYYLKLTASRGPLLVYGRAEDQYPYGQAYLNGQALPGDLAMQVIYPVNVLDGDLLLRLIQLLPALAMVLVIPGRLLLLLSGNQWDAGEQLALSVGLSLAIYPTIMTWTSLVSVRWSAPIVMLLGLALYVVFLYLRLPSWVAQTGLALNQIHAMLLAALGGVWMAFPLETALQDAISPGQSRWLYVALPLLCAIPFAWRRLPTPRDHQASPFPWHGLALAAVLFGALWVRLAMVQTLAVPAWVDSVHHAVFLKLMEAAGTFPQSYAPLLNIETSSYHLGFHTSLLVFNWVWNEPLPTAMLSYAQALNALAAAAAYLFARQLTGNRTAGICAALFTGFFTPMPAYYASWGRFTQLAGLLILPAAYALLKTCGQAKWKQLVLAGVACAGLFLTHYRVLAFLALLLAGEALIHWGIQAWRKNGKTALKKEVLRLGIPALIAVLLTLPWWPPALHSLFIPKLAWGAGRAELFNDFSWSHLTSAAGIYPLALSGLGLAWGLIQRKTFPFSLALWTAGMFLAANLGAWSLPGAGFINNTSVTISLYLPISALAGYPLGVALEGWSGLAGPRQRPWLSGALGAALLGAALFGSTRLLPLLNTSTFLARQADLAAMDQVKQLVPEGEEVLINPFAWGYGLYAGRDGGYWISALAGRPTLPPPVLYGLAEDPGQIDRVKAAAQAVLDHGADPPALAAWMDQAGVKFIYVGRRGGALSPATLSSSPLFKILYQAEGIWLFRRNGPIRQE